MMTCSETTAALKTWVIGWAVAFCLSLLMFLPNMQLSPSWYCGIVGAIFFVSAILVVIALD